MKQPTQNPMAYDSAQDAASGAAEETLRLIAGLRVPEGLEERVRAGLRSRSRTGRILAWPAAPRLDSDWMRAAAAAALVFVVAGGGWGIYSRVQQTQPARVIAMPPHIAAPGGFSSAGAMRTPNTLNGPVLVHPVTALPAHGKAAAAGALKKKRRAPSSAAGKTALPATAQSAAPAAK